MQQNVVCQIKDKSINEAKIVACLGVIKEKLKNELPRNQFKNIVEVTIEVIQNIVNYSASSNALKGNRREGFGSFLLQKESQERYKIVTSNPISATRKELLETTIATLKELNTQELKRLGKERIASKKFYHDKGTGIGLIRIFTKVPLPITIEFRAIDEGEYIFSMELFL